MKRLGIVGVSIISFVIVGSFSFDPVYGQDGFGYCHYTPLGKFCSTDPEYFTPFTITIYLAVVAGVSSLFYEHIH